MMDNNKLPEEDRRFLSLLQETTTHKSGADYGKENFDYEQAKFFVKEGGRHFISDSGLRRLIKATAKGHEHMEALKFLEFFEPFFRILDRLNFFFRLGEILNELGFLFIRYR